MLRRKGDIGRAIQYLEGARDTTPQAELASRGNKETERYYRGLYLCKMSTRILMPLQNCQNAGTFIAQQNSSIKRRKESTLKLKEHSQCQGKCTEIMLKFRLVNV
jgi:hypothetical protein